jgi:hypothetical protein
MIIVNYTQMNLQCLQCAGSLRDRVLVARLGDIDVWFCDSCEIYNKNEIKDLVFRP